MDIFKESIKSGLRAGIVGLWLSVAVSGLRAGIVGLWLSVAVSGLRAGIVGMWLSVVISGLRAGIVLLWLSKCDCIRATRWWSTRCSRRPRLLLTPSMAGTSSARPSQSTGASARDPGSESWEGGGVQEVSRGMEEVQEVNRGMVGVQEASHGRVGLRK